MANPMRNKNVRSQSIFHGIVILIFVICLWRISTLLTSSWVHKVPTVPSRNASHVATWGSNSSRVNSIPRASKGIAIKAPKQLVTSNTTITVHKASQRRRREIALRPVVPRPNYVHQPRNPQLAQQRQRLEEHIKSSEYTERLEAIQKLPERGILINAGGARYTTNLIITLKVLRETLGCKLPVHVAWQGKHEMDNVTWQNILRNFGPISGADVTLMKHPVASLQWPNFRAVHYPGKVFGVLTAPFREVLMVDADSMPLQQPERYFELEEFRTNGVLFWPDAWTGAVKPQAYEMLGASMQKAKEVLNAGCGGRNCRDTESGQVLVDRSRHLDALEYVLWANTHENSLRNFLWGDKDTFPMGWALAGKAHLFTQVKVAPGGIFSWRDKMLLTKATGQRSAGWQLLGFLQHDPFGRPAFLHRTINKWRTNEKPWRLEIISAPMTKGWTGYYLAHMNSGPTRGVPWDYVVPSSALREMSLQLPAQKLAPGSSCPMSTFQSYVAMKRAGLGIDDWVELEGICSGTGNAQLAGQAVVLDTSTAPLQVDTEPSVSPSTPLPAWRPKFADPLPYNGSMEIAIRAAYRAHAYLIEHKSLFPVTIERKRLLS